MAPRLPRSIHKLYANLLGYFWSPCPLCGRYFGGHEDGSWVVMDTPFSGRLVCRDCGAKAQQMNVGMYERSGICMGDL